MEVPSRFALVSIGIYRAILHHVRDLAMAAREGKLSAIPPQTGMVWSACQKIQTLPDSNQVAYRRSIMEVRC